MPVYATERISIRWLPAEPYEDTETLVISVNEHFLDVRVKKDHKSIDWAFAGTKRVEADGRNVWTHEIDSRGSKEEDLGYVTVLPNGDELESGSMRNPETGTIMRHEEIWHSLSLRQERGFIARHKDEKAFLGVVDVHCLILCIDQGISAVARYLHTVHGGWKQQFKLDDAGLLDGLEEGLIENISSNTDWTILSSEGL